jgi:hypothetical protein
MALGLTQPLPEMSIRNLPGDKGWPARKADNLTGICEPIVYKMWEPWRLTTLWASRTSYRDSFTFLTFFLSWFADDRRALGDFRSTKWISAQYPRALQESRWLKGDFFCNPHTYPHENLECPVFIISIPKCRLATSTSNFTREHSSPLSFRTSLNSSCLSLCGKYSVIMRFELSVR